jgi:hypothetical protein
MDCDLASLLDFALPLDLTPPLDLAPPPEQTFETYKELKTTLQDFARCHGYAIIIGRSYQDRKGEIKV